MRLHPFRGQKIPFKSNQSTAFDNKNSYPVEDPKISGSIVHAFILTLCYLGTTAQKQKLLILSFMFRRRRFSRKMSRQGSVLREDSVREKQLPPRGTEEADRLIEEEAAAEGAVSIT